MGDQYGHKVLMHLMFINLLSSHTSVRKTLPDNYIYVNQKVSYKSCEFHVPWNMGMDSRTGSK